MPTTACCCRQQRMASANSSYKENKHDKKVCGCYIVTMNSMNQLLEKAIHLPEDQRLALVHKLLLAGEPHASRDVENAWDAEIRDRIARYDLGNVPTRPAGKVFSDLDRRLES